MSQKRKTWQLWSQLMGWMDTLREIYGQLNPQILANNYGITLSRICNNRSCPIPCRRKATPNQLSEMIIRNTTILSQYTTVGGHAFFFPID